MGWKKQQVHQYVYGYTGYYWIHYKAYTAYRYLLYMNNVHTETPFLSCNIHWSRFMYITNF